jgi:Ran GTPase-activating protein 1
LAEAFKVIRTLEEISMPQNGIRAEGIIRLADAIRMNPELKKLNLGDNTFGEAGAIAMSSALATLSQLEMVDFSDCLCRNRGSMMIAQNLVESGSQLKVNMICKEDTFRLSIWVQIFKKIDNFLDTFMTVFRCSFINDRRKQNAKKCSNF